MGITKRKSFTLMELIVAVGIIGIILPTVFNVFFIIIRQQLILVSYQTMKQQGDSTRRNIQNILQNRAAYVTDQSYIATDVCPLITTPTPPYSPGIYLKDRDGKIIHIYPTPTGTINLIASDSANADGSVIKTYNLTSPDVTITDLGFSCYKVNDFSPEIVSTTFTVRKSTLFKEISLPYLFNVKLRDY